MAVVFRSVRLVVQNSSHALLTLAAGEVLLGGWGPPGPPRTAASAIAPQSAATFTTQSTVLQTGSEAFVRLASALGPIQVHWRLPWVGPFALRCEASADRWHVGTEIFDHDPAAVAALVTLQAVTREA